MREHASAAAGLAQAEAGSAAGVVGSGLARAEADVACFVATRRCTAAAAWAREGKGRSGSYIRLCRAMDEGVAVPRQDRWRGRALPR